MSPEEGDLTLRYDLRINQGETFQLSVPVLESDGDPAVLSDLTVRGQIRSHASSATVLHEWSFDDDNVAFDSNNLVLTVPATASAAWNFRTGQWDVEISDTSGTTTRLIEGLVIVHPEVTR